MNYYDEDDFLDDKTGPYFSFFGGLIVIAVIFGMIYSSFDKNDLRKNYIAHLRSDSIYLEKNTDSILKINKIDLNKIGTTGNDKIIRFDFYRFGFISNADTIWYSLHQSYGYDNELFLLDEKNDVVIGKYFMR